MMLRLLLAAGLLPLAGCAATSGVIAVGPDTYTLSEMLAPAIGGGPAAESAALARAGDFCRRQGRSALLLDAHPDGDPYTPYYPTAYDATFRCK